VQRFRLRRVRITPALVISMIALFVALSSTGFASTIVPLAKRALTADKAKVATTAKTAGNALKLNGLTAEQIATTPGPATDLQGQTAAQIAATPGPASSVSNSLFALRSTGWSIDQPRGKVDARVLCTAGERAVGGGWDESSGDARVLADKPTPDGSGWLITLDGPNDDSVPAAGSAWAVCQKITP
jgi:hypothetical protein